MGLGWWMTSLPDEPRGLQAPWFNLHKSIGLCIGLLVLLRLGWRVAHGPSPLEHLPRWQQRAARTTHALLYACMALLPLSGYLGSVFSGYPVRWFGVVLPSWTAAWPVGKTVLSAIHLGTVVLFTALVALHVAAAVWHWWRGDDVAGRMGLPARTGVVP